MNESRKKIFSVLFFFALMALTFWYVLRDRNLGLVLHYLSSMKLIYVIPAVLAVIAFILGESVVIFYLLRKLGNQPRFSHCALYSFIGFFYSAVTPSASGGQPMQVIAMRRDGISGAVSAVVLAIVTITYKLVLVLLGVVVLGFRPAAVVKYLDGVEGWMYLGLVLNVTFIGFLFMVVFHPATVRMLMKGLFGLLNRFRLFKDEDAALAKWEQTISSYSGTAAFFKSNPRIIIKVFLITVVQRFCLFSVIWFTYKAFGMRGQSPIVTMLLFGMISVAADMMPLPGGMGISETLFLSIFEPIFGTALVLPGMLVSRGISYYTQLLISAVMTAFAHFVFREKKKQE